jgi:polyisoprenoid-binding protein YceI
MRPSIVDSNFLPPARVKFVIDARQMKALDPQLSTDKRRQVQERILGPEVLDSIRFPRISFESTSVEPVGQDALLVKGKLSLHGVNRPAIAKVRKENGRYLASRRRCAPESGQIQAGRRSRSMEDV